MSLDFGGSDTSSQAATQSQTQSNQNSSGTYQNGPVNAPQLQGALDSARALYEQGNPTAIAGMNGINAGVASAGNLFGAGNQTLANTLNGTYVNGQNPALQSMFGSVGDQVQRRTAQAFSGDDASFGSPAHQAALTSNLASAFAPIAYQNYATERGYQNGALSQLPSYTASLLAPGQAQLSAGYVPINQYIQQLGAISPGTSGTYQQKTDGTQFTNGNQTGSQSTFGFNAGGKLAGGGGGGGGGK